MFETLTPGPRDVLIVIDPQNDFCPGGALAVPNGDEVMAPIAELAARFANVVITQDWHPADQISFASTHGRDPFSQVEVAYGPQVLWPDHCVQGTPGADFHPLIRERVLDRAQLILRKGYNRAVDSYSAFFENDRTTATGLAGYLHDRGLTRCVFAGLALDFCVRYSAEDARALGFEAVVLEAATRAIDLDGSRATALQAMRQAGVEILRA